MNYRSCLMAFGVIFHMLPQDKHDDKDNLALLDLGTTEPGQPLISF